MSITTDVMAPASSQNFPFGVMTQAAYSPESLHMALMRLNRTRLEPGVPDFNFSARYEQQRSLVLAESEFVEAERLSVSAQAASVPRDPRAFAEWFESLRETGPGQHDPLFEYLATRATFEELRWFVRQEAAGEAGFDDLVSLTQIRMPETAKLELARNYWDEMGRGKYEGMHGPMLHHLARTLDVLDTPLENIVWESLALANLLVALAYNRRYAFHAVGALGGVELTAPSRAVRVVEALDRLGVDKTASYYFRLHSTVDIGHWRGWRDNVAIPLVTERPEVAPYIAEGALMRLNAGARTFARYRAFLGIHA